MRRGQHGTAWTVFEGRVPEPMDVEILGRMPNSIGPGQDMILARLHGTKPDFTGVVAGMSGSPVYIDGKLLGALSFRIGQFSKEPICGITPIEYMLQVRDLPNALNPTAPERPAPPATPAEPVAALAPSFSPARNDGLTPIATPLVFSGFSADTLDRFGANFRALGLEPVSGLGSASPDTPQPEPIVPGSAVSAVLARGDLNIAATCTVTYLDAKQLLACGHPITQYGDIDVPMTKAEVLATLPSPQNAFKIVNTTETVGAFTEDRSNAIAGSFRVQAPMIPVAVELAPVAGSGLPARTLHFQVLNNRELTPQVLLAGVYQALSGTNTSGSEMSLRLTGSVAIANHEPLRLDATLSSGEGQPAAVGAAVLLAQRFSRVYGNALEQPVITAVDLHAAVVPTRESIQIESARLSTDEARPGDTVVVQATIRPWQQSARVVEVPIKLPTTLENGPLRIVVGDSTTMDRLVAPPAGSAPHPLDLADTITQLNRTHTNDRLYVALLDHETQGVTAAAALPSLPPDVVNTLQPLRDSREISFTSETAKEAGSVPLDAAVSGSQVLTLRIR
ncbi:SpoIVB peptidase S55 domain-containing protein [Terriglobus aquaticus]